MNELHPCGHSRRIVITPSVSIDLSTFRIKSVCTSIDCSRTKVVVGSVWIPTWQIFWASNARRVASRIFAFSNAFLFTFCGAAVITVRHGGRSFSIVSFVFSFDDFLADLVALLQWRDEGRKTFKNCSAIAFNKRSCIQFTTLQSARVQRTSPESATPKNEIILNKQLRVVNACRFSSCHRYVE